MGRRIIADTLGQLRPQDLWPAWRVINLQERERMIGRNEAKRWKEGTYETRPRWPRRGNRRPRELRLAVSYVAGRRHLPVIELRRAA